MSDKIYEYRVTSIRLFDGSVSFPPSVIVDVHYSLAELYQAASGNEGTLTLRMARDDHETIASLLQRARTEAPRVLAEASRLIDAHIPQDGRHAQSKDGFGS